MEENSKTNYNKQVITLTSGQTLTANGVLDIAAFDENGVVLDTLSGSVTVEGEELKIESLEKNGGFIVVTGKISGFFRTDKPVVKKGLFGRIFG
jgi:formylmethanofuran dehydrogenase subunit C